MIIIGLHGEAESGKDTICKMLQEAFPETRIKREAFADRLKISAMKALGLNEEDGNLIEWANKIKAPGYYVEVVEAASADKLPPKELEGALCITGREYLQYYGTEAHRDVFGQDFWLDAVLPYKGDDNPEILVITDVRFINEAQRVRDCGGEIWHIIRGSKIKESDHSSEKPLPPELIDLTIFNDGSLEDLRRIVKDVYRNPETIPYRSAIHANKDNAGKVPVVGGLDA